MVTATEGLPKEQSQAEYVIWSYVEKSLGVLSYRGKVLQIKQQQQKAKNPHTTQIFNSELANTSTINDEWG